MIVTISEVKTFLRIDLSYTEEDNIISLLISAAESYLKNVTGIQFDSTNSLAKLFCLVIISDWYDDRSMVGRISERIRFTIDSILTQLTYCYAEETI